MPAAITVRFFVNAFFLRVYFHSLKIYLKEKERSTQRPFFISFPKTCYSILPFADFSCPQAAIISSPRERRIGAANQWLSKILENR